MERKLATVLFVDLVDSTSLVAGTDPGRASARERVLRDRLELCRAARRLVEKFAGDLSSPRSACPRRTRTTRFAPSARRSRCATRSSSSGCRRGWGSRRVSSSSRAPNRRSRPARPSTSPRASSRSRGRGDPRRPDGLPPRCEASWPRTRGPSSSRGSASRSAWRLVAALDGPSRQLGPRARSSVASRARAAREHVRAHDPRSPRACLHRSTASRRRQEPSREGVPRRARAGELPRRARPALRRGRDLLAPRGDGQGRGRHLRRRPARRGFREAPRVPPRSRSRMSWRSPPG